MDLRNISDRQIQDLLNVQALQDYDGYFRSRYMPKFESPRKSHKESDSIEELMAQVEHDKRSVYERIIYCMHGYIRQYGRNPNTVMLHPRQYHELIREEGYHVNHISNTGIAHILGMEVLISQDVEDVCVATVMKYI